MSIWRFSSTLVKRYIIHVNKNTTVSPIRAYFKKEILLDSFLFGTKSIELLFVPFFILVFVVTVKGIQKWCTKDEINLLNSETDVRVPVTNNRYWILLICFVVILKKMLFICWRYSMHWYNFGFADSWYNVSIKLKQLMIPVHCMLQLMEIERIKEECANVFPFSVSYIILFLVHTK